MSVFLTYSVIGIVAGAIYAITATGLVVTYSTTGVFNFAHGAVGMVAAFSFYQFWQAWHWPVLAALAAVLVVEAPLLGVLAEAVFMRRLARGATEQSLMVTLGLLLILVGLAGALWNPETNRTVPVFFGGDSVRIAGVYVSAQQILTVAVAALVAGALALVLRKARIGVAMRAAVDDPDLVALTGARPVRVSQAGWILGFVLAATAGVLLASTVSATGLNIDTLTLLVVNGYAAAVVGRLRNLPATFAGGIGLGLLVNYAIGYLPNHLPTSLVAEIPQVIPVAFLFVVLLVLPSGRLTAARRPLRASAPPGAARSILGALVVVALALVVGPFLGRLGLGTVTDGLALGIVALSLVLLTGYGGQVSLCQLTFLGFGAYVMGKVAGGGSWAGLVAGVAASAALGALVALPVLRLRGLYLALATLAFGEAASAAFFANPSVFPGYGGSVAVGRLPLPALAHPDGRVELVVTAVAFSLCALGVLAVRRGRFGRRLVAMGDSPVGFATLGISPGATKVAVFAASAGLAGLGGCLYAGQQGGISANDVPFLASLTLLLFVAIWGIRSATGALLGGLSAVLLPLAQTHLPAAWSGLSGLVAGVGIVVLGRNAEGLVGLSAQLVHRRGSPLERSGDLAGWPSLAGTGAVAGASGGTGTVAGASGGAGTQGGLGEGPVGAHG